MMYINKESESKLHKYGSLLLEWNKSINLISRTTEKDFWNRHIIDSAQIFKHLLPEDHVYDLGSGAGLPGIILSILGIKHVTLIEKSSRKCAFLNQASLLSENKISIINDRIENCTNIPTPKINILTSRALSSLNNLLEYNKFFMPTKGFLILKGQSFQKELEDARKNWDFDVEIFPSITNIESAILRINNVIQKN